MYFFQNSIVHLQVLNLWKTSCLPPVEFMFQEYAKVACYRTAKCKADIACVVN